MSRQWLYVLSAVMVSGVFSLVLSPANAAHFGWLSLLGGVIYLVSVISTGIDSKRVRQGKTDDVAVVVDHQIHVSILTTFILVGVVAMEIAVRKVGGLWGSPTVITLHLVLVGFAIVAYAIARFRTTGLRDRKRHRYVVYPFATLYIAAFATGTILLMEQFPIGQEVLASVVR